MDSVIIDCISGIRLSRPKVYGNIAVIPLLFGNDDQPEYLTMDEALKKKLTTITEVSEGGSVPKLLVINDADVPILLLDGEELLGAKQNRILNAAILVRERAKTPIPVSCCEQGRWHYTSKHFDASEYAAPCCMRQDYMNDVSASLRASGEYQSDQGRVWQRIQHMASESGVESPTCAMEDVFHARKQELDEHSKAFGTRRGQKGIMVMVDGEVVGFDFVSLASAYRVLHPKLIKSYTFDVVDRKKKEAQPPSVEKAKAFLAEALSCSEEKYQSAGYGWNHRFEGNQIVGAALVHEGKVIHTSFFRKQREHNDRMPGRGIRRCSVIQRRSKPARKSDDSQA